MLTSSRQPGTAASPPLLAAARILSIAGHPLVLIPLTMAAATRRWLWTAAIAGSVVLPLAYVVARRVRRGAWSDFDVSRHDQRAGLYRAAAPFLALFALILYILGADARILRGVVAAVLMLSTGLVANRWLKVSLHMMFAAYCAVIISRLYPAALIPCAAFALAIAWSRHLLGRHTLPELVAGTAIGIAGALFALA